MTRRDHVHGDATARRRRYGEHRDRRPRAGSTPSPAATGTTIVERPSARSTSERIVVNMGPQHPSTHGVLRLILELDGETVTEARVGHRLPAHRHREEHGVPHLDPGRHVRHAHATTSSPLFNEAAYCLGVERLLGIEDEIPERANVIRVMMMELNRISSHLVCARHRRHGARRADGDDCSASASAS